MSEGMHGGVTLPPGRMYERRERVFSVAARDLFDLLSGSRNYWWRLALVTEAGEALPRTAQLMFVGYNALNRTFDLLFYDPSYPVVPDGQETPRAGLLLASGERHPSLRKMGEELDAAAAVIHDLREQLGGR